MHALYSPYLPLHPDLTLAPSIHQVGEDEGLTLDASASADPNEPTAALQFAWSCSTPDADAGAGAGTDDDAIGCPTLPATTATDPTLALPPGVLPPGRFMFAVGVSKACVHMTAEL